MTGTEPSETMARTRVLLIEGDEAFAQVLMKEIERSGMVANWAGSGAKGMQMRETFKPHIVIMELALPDLNGMSLIARMTETRDCGVIVLSELGEEADRIVGLELGADDYIVKPPGMRELVARVRAVHRRLTIRTEAKAPAPASTILKVGPIRINILHRTVHTEDGRRLPLTSAEFSALEALAGAAGAAVSRDRLSEIALRRPWRAEDRSVDQLVFNLRQKLPLDDGGGMLIQSIRGSGYWLRAPETLASAEMRVALPA